MSELTDDRLAPCPFCDMYLRKAQNTPMVGMLEHPANLHCPISAVVFTDTPSYRAAWNRRAAASTRTEGAGVTDALDEIEAVRRKFKLWFFRDLSDEQRLALFRLMMPDIPGREFATHASQSAGLKFCLDALNAALNPPAPKVTTDEAEERG